MGSPCPLPQFPVAPGDVLPQFPSVAGGAARCPGGGPQHALKAVPSSPRGRGLCSPKILSPAPAVSGQGRGAGTFLGASAGWLGTDGSPGGQAAAGRRGGMQQRSFSCVLPHSRHLGRPFPDPSRHHRPSHPPSSSSPSSSSSSSSSPAARRQPGGMCALEDTVWGRRRSPPRTRREGLTCTAALGTEEEEERGNLIPRPPEPPARGSSSLPPCPLRREAAESSRGGQKRGCV